MHMIAETYLRLFPETSFCFDHVVNLMEVKPSSSGDKRGLRQIEKKSLALSGCCTSRVTLSVRRSVFR